MKNLILCLFLLPLLAISQSNSEYMIFENGLIKPNPKDIQKFEAGMAAHNKKYHGDGPFGARVYTISNGTNVGGYMWVMGPLPWSAMDNRPAQQGHDEDWNKNVMPYILPDGDQTYWKFESDLSNFPKDFNIKNLLVDVYDVKRFQGKKAMDLLKKVKKVMVEKYPDEPYGIYTNEFSSTKEGKDIAFVSFFDKSAWLGEDMEFAKKYNEVYGDDSFSAFLRDWGEATNGSQTEVWVYRPDLSGISGSVKAASRQ